MAPHAVHFIRHAEGYHDSEQNEDLRDPDLTPKGREECQHLATIFPFFDRIDLVCASPIRRAIQTALISMEPYLKSGKQNILALPLAQEATATPADTPSDINRLEDEYGDKVDFRHCLDTYVDYNTNKGKWAPDGAALQARALELRKFLRDRDELEVVVVSHGNFMHYVTGDIKEDGSQDKGFWKNTEFRSYRFFPVGHDEALLQETEESVRMRRARGEGEQMGSSGKEGGEA